MVRLEYTTPEKYVDSLSHIMVLSVCEAKQSVLDNMYQFLTGNSSATSISKDAEKLQKFMLDSQDRDVIFDLLVNNPGRPDVYAEFGGLFES